MGTQMELIINENDTALKRGLTEFAELIIPHKPTLTFQPCGNHSEKVEVTGSENSYEITETYRNQVLRMLSQAACNYYERKLRPLMK